MRADAIILPETFMRIGRLIIGLAIVGSFVCMTYLNGGRVGFSYMHSGDKTMVSVATHPVLLAWAAAAISCYWILMRTETHSDRTGHVGLTRRFIAYILDCYLVVFACSSILSLIPLYLEAKRTGHFAWSFERDYAVRTDYYTTFLLSLAALFGLFLYYTYPLLKGKQTVGSFIVRTRARPASRSEGNATFWLVCKRIFYAGLGLALWPYTLWRYLDGNGRTWYDRASNWDVTLVNYK